MPLTTTGAYLPPPFKQKNLQPHLTFGRQRYLGILSRGDLQLALRPPSRVYSTGQQQPSNSIAVFSRVQPSSGLECPFQMAGLQLSIEHCAKCLNPSARGTAQLRRQPLAPFCQYCALLDDFFQTFAKNSLIFHPVLTTQLNRQCSLGVKAFYNRSFLSSYK